MNKLYILLAILMMAGCSGSANRNGSDDIGSDIGISSGTDSSVSTGVNTSSSGSDTSTSTVSSSSSGTISDEVTCKAFWDSFPKEIVGKQYVWVAINNSISYDSLRKVIPSSVNLDLDPNDIFITSSSLDTEKNVIYWGGKLITVDNLLCSANVVTTSTNNVVSTDAKVVVVINSIKYNNTTL